MIFDWILKDSQLTDQQLLMKLAVDFAKICSLPLSTLVKLFQRFVEKILDSIVSRTQFLFNNLINSYILVYLDVGRGASDCATLAFTFSGTFSRYWDIKVTQIPCDVNYE